uniref:Uncharacterized protein n=1 Tax=Avena sativa TaxID=4498 RepID=A0ACD5V7V4_AVESA
FNAGGNSELFSVEVCHNGFFCVLRDNLSYLCTSTAVFDNCNAHNWSTTSIDEILRYLGYQRDGVLQVYWCLPGKDIADGLVPVDRETHFAEMVRLSISHKTLVLYIDHKNFIRKFKNEVILTEGPFIPGVISPRRVPWTSNLVEEQEQPNEGLAEKVEPIVVEVLEGGGLAEQVQPIVDKVLQDHLHADGGLVQQVEPIVDEVLEDHLHADGGLVEQVEPIVDEVLEDQAHGIGGLAEQLQPIVDEVLEDHVQEVQVDMSDSESDCSIYDSDYDAEDGDDDLFADNVDIEVNDNNEKEIVEENEDEEALEDEDLNMIGEEREKLKHNIRAFNPEVDMDNPIFKIGMVFSGVEEARKALAAYTIRNRVQIKKMKNDKRRLEAVCDGDCDGGCNWYFKAANDSRFGGFVLNAYEGNHRCENVWELRALTANVLKEKFINEFRDNQKLDLKGFSAKVTREFNMTPERWKLGRARKAALLEIHGDEEEQFRLLHDYGQELKRSNPGSTFFLSTNSVNDPTSTRHKEHLST